MSQIIQNDLKNAGLMINYKKSQLDPVTFGKWLGFNIDTEKMLFKVPLEKIDKIIVLLDDVLSAVLTTPRKIAKIAGNLISISIAIGKISRLFTRQMYFFIENRKYWDDLSILPNEVIKELQFWKKGLSHNNGFRIRPSQVTSKVVFSDASNNGYGGYIVDRLGDIICKGFFTRDEINTSSTYRELLAVKRMLQSIGFLLRNENVQWNTDNLNITRIMQVGSSKKLLQNTAIEIFELCLCYNIEIFPQWIPRDKNNVADKLSKQQDNDNWSIDNISFEYIRNKFGNFTIDRFADNLNKKVPRFNSKYYCPGLESVNAFTCDWGRDFNWICPPISLIAKTLKHLELCKAVGVLFVPNWPSSYFWPLLTSDGQEFNSFIKDFICLDPDYINNSFSKSVFSGKAKFLAYALLVDFR